MCVCVCVCVCVCLHIYIKKQRLRTTATTKMSQSLAKFLDLIQFLTPKPLTEIKAGFHE